MARPRKCRRICSEPSFDRFAPLGASSAEAINLTVDEYEVIRLIDYEALTQVQCSEQMEVSRTTVTEIYDCARRKIADAIVNGRGLVIDGGTYKYCDGSARHCHGRCGNNAPSAELDNKGDNIMRIAVTYENGQIYQHFGHTQFFKMYDIEDGKIVNAQVVGTNGQGHGALAGFLFNGKVDALICGGIGGGAQNALAQAGIKLYGGVSGDADEAVRAFIGGTLGYNPNVRCDHHDHHGEGHSCGEHDCGSHSCH